MSLWWWKIKLSQCDFWVYNVGCRITRTLQLCNCYFSSFLKSGRAECQAGRPGRLMTLMSSLSNQGSQLMPAPRQTLLPPQWDSFNSVVVDGVKRSPGLLVCLSLCTALSVQSPAWLANISLKFSSHSSHQLWVAWIKVTREGPPPPLSNNGQIPAILLLLFWINVRCEIFERFGQFMTVVTRYIGDISIGDWEHQPILSSSV